jgi:hypothetical protein
VRVLLLALEYLDLLLRLQRHLVSGGGAAHREGRDYIAKDFAACLVHHPRVSRCKEPRVTGDFAATIEACP